MSVRDRGGKYWDYRFVYRGHEYTGSTGFECSGKDRAQNKVLATATEAEIRRLVVHGKADTLKLKAIPFMDAAELFLEDCRINAVEASSYKRIKGSFNSLKAYFKKKAVSAISRSNIREYKNWRLTQPRRNGRPVKPITVRHDLTSLGKFFKFGVVKDWCHSNPVHEDDVPSDKDAVRIQIVTPEEERCYFAKALKLGLRQLHDLCRLMLLMGCRPEELISVKVTHLDLDLPRPRLQIVKGKTKAAKRNLALHGEAKEILTRLKGAAEKAGSEYVFQAERDPKLKLSMSTVETQQARLEMPFVIYDFRHTFATRALRDGADLVSLAMIMGHDGIRSIMKYVHLGQADMDNTLLSLHRESKAVAS